MVARPESIATKQKIIEQSSKWFGKKINTFKIDIYLEESLQSTSFFIGVDRFCFELVNAFLVLLVPKASDGRKRCETPLGNARCLENRSDRQKNGLCAGSIESFQRKFVRDVIYFKFCHTQFFVWDDVIDFVQRMNKSFEKPLNFRSSFYYSN